MFDHDIHEESALSLPLEAEKCGTIKRYTLHSLWLSLVVCSGKYNLKIHMNNMYVWGF